MIDIRFTNSPEKVFTDKIVSDYNKLLSSLVNQIAQEVIQETPVDTGLLVSNWRIHGTNINSRPTYNIGDIYYADAISAKIDASQYVSTVVQTISSYTQGIFGSVILENTTPYAGYVHDYYRGSFFNGVIAKYI